MYRRRCQSHTQVLYLSRSHLIVMVGWQRSTVMSRCYCTTVSMSFHERNQRITILLIDLHRGETRDHQSQRQARVVWPIEMHPATFLLQVFHFISLNPSTSKTATAAVHLDHKTSPTWNICQTQSKPIQLCSTWNVLKCWFQKSIERLTQNQTLVGTWELNSPEGLLCYWLL